MGFFASDPTIISFKDLNGEQGEFFLDASVSIITSLKAKVTSYPVQDKNFITDHVQAEPLRLKIDGIISQSPSNTLLTLLGGLFGNIINQATSLTGLSSTFATAAVASGVAAFASLGNPLDEQASFARLLSDRGFNDNDYPKRAMKGMTFMFNSGVPFKVRTFYESNLYQNMVMDSLTFPQVAKTGDSLRFMMSCVKIKTVASSFDVIGGVGELLASDPAGSSAAAAKSKGAVTGTTAAAEEADESFLSSVLSIF